MQTGRRLVAEQQSELRKKKEQVSEPPAPRDMSGWQTGKRMAAEQHVSGPEHFAAGIELGEQVPEPPARSNAGTPNFSRY